MAVKSVITEFRQKLQDGYANYPLGARAQHVFGIRGGGVHNIEENILLGCSTITTETEDPLAGYREIKEEYRNPDQTTNYYYLTIKVFYSTTTGRRWFYGEGLYLPSDSSDNIYYPTYESLLLRNQEGIDPVYQFIDSTDTLEINNEDTESGIASEAKLFFVNSEGQHIFIATKTIYMPITVVDENDVSITTQKKIVTYPNGSYQREGGAEVNG